MTDSADGDRSAALLGLFALSGAASLIYEVVWVRQLTTLVGASAYAVTVVLAAFMVGLGLGAWLLGKLADRLSERGLARAYVLLELGIGTYALALPGLLVGAQARYVALYRATGAIAFETTTLRLTLCFLLFLIPTTLMGGTLPVLSRYVIRRNRRIPGGLSRLYAANTLGALGGTVAAGFVFLPSLGILQTTWVAAGLNAAVAVGFRLVRTARPAFPPEADRTSMVVGRATEPGATPLQRAVVLGFGLSGAAAMIYEVAWTRTLSMILGTTTFAFTTMLATFLLGVGLGSALYGLIPARCSRPKLFGTLQCLAAFTALATVPLFERLPLVYLSLHDRWVHSWFDVQFLRFGLAALVMFLPTLALGLAFPVASAVFVDATGRMGRRLGKAYALNTLGAVAGTGLASLVLIPQLGLQKTIVAASALNLAAGVGAWLWVDTLPRTRRALWAAGASLAALALIFAIRPWSPRVMSSGVYLYASHYQDMEEHYNEVAARRDDVAAANPWTLWRAAMEQYELLFYRPGVTATVAVMERQDGVRFLTIDRKDRTARL